MSSGLTTYIEIYALTFLFYDWGNPITFVYLIFLISIIETALFSMCYTVHWFLISLMIKFNIQ